MITCRNFCLGIFRENRATKRKTKSQIIATSAVAMTSASSQASSLKAIAKATYETLLVQGYVEENEVNIFCRLVKEEWEAARDSVLFQYTAVGMTVPKYVTRVTVDPSVKHIPENAFRDCTRLVEVRAFD